MTHRMVPPAAPGPEALPGADAAEVLTDLVLTTFHLNGRFLEVADSLAAPVGLTAARWQVVGAVLRKPQTVAAIARTMGLARQSVQRIADLLVAEGFAEYLDNPAHKRAKLLNPTPRTREGLPLISARQFEWATGIAQPIGVDDLRQAVGVLHRVIRALDGESVRDAGAASLSTTKGGPLPARNPETGKVWSHPTGPYPAPTPPPAEQLLSPAPSHGE